MPKLTYKKDDSYFYKWWKEIYQQQLDLYKKFSTPGIVFAPLTDKDFEIFVNGNVLTIRGEKRPWEAEQQADFHVSERFFGPFIRSIPLTDAVDPNKITAKFANGVLQIELQKTQQSKSSSKKVKLAS